jgi:putative pyruvate formate lyase activating enzyme
LIGKGDDMFEPSYIKLYRSGELQKRIESAVQILENCELCPRRCGVNRLQGEKGYCGTGRKARVASYNAHFGEESPLVGKFGSGTIFFSSCNLLCSFCQNYEISHMREGMDVEPQHIAEMMIRLANGGCHNINFVTPTHVVPQILESLPIAIERGLRVPLVYNCGGYEMVETIKLLEGVIDIYMPDFKFWEPMWSERYCNAGDYKEMACSAIKEMHRQVGDLIINEEGIAERGLLIRHLVMPRDVSSTRQVLKFIAHEISPNTYVNVMDQYRPCGNAYQYEYINRRLSAKEFREAMKMARDVGLVRLDPRDRIRFIFAI